MKRRYYSLVCEIDRKYVGHICSGGARVFAARGKRLCCRPSPHLVAYLEI